MTTCGWLWPRRSTHQKVNGLIPMFSSPRAQVSLGKTLDPQLQLTAAPAVHE